MKPKIGFIGIGIMGSHMSRHLMKDGYETRRLRHIQTATGGAGRRGR